MTHGTGSSEGPIGPWRAARAIHAQLGPARRRQLGWTLVLMIVGALAELATIGAVLPFLAIITPGAAGGRYGAVTVALERAAAGVGMGPVAFAALLLILIAAGAAAIRLLLIWVSQKVVFDTAHDLAMRIYTLTLHQPYPYHTANNTSTTLSGVEKVQFVLSSVLMPAMVGFTAALVAVTILIALLAIDPVMTGLAALCFGLLYATISRLTRRRLYRNADVIAHSLRTRVQALQEGLGGIRDVLLDRSQPIFIAKFRRIDDAFRRAQIVNQFIGTAPRAVVEAGGVVLIAVLALYVSGTPGGLVAALPKLGALALGAQRLLPLAQQVYVSSAQVHGNRAALAEVAALLAMPEPVADSPVVLPPFAGEIAIDHVGFHYPAAERPALAGVTLTIARGTRVGLVGKSGSGKSTLVDLLLGLLEPTTGTIRIDGTPLTADVAAAWQRQIAHVPQAIFLSDGTIAANIAFGQPEEAIDLDRVRRAARDADLDAFVQTLPDGYATATGERGVRLSGGQRQRIGIARALYKQATVLVLDEATSALDDETEASVMASIARLSRELTVIAIAHRTSTLRDCDLVVRMEDGRIAATGSFAAIVGSERAEA